MGGKNDPAESKGFAPKTKRVVYKKK